MVKLMSLLKFSWLRKCKVCRVRGAKCLCKRPSLALEHIFFLEERKNKFGARNFSHVSDTMVTTTSSAVMSANNTVLMRGSSFGDEYAFADYYYNPSGSNSTNNALNQQRQSLTGSRGSQGSRGSGGSVGGRRNKKRASPTSTTALVRKNSGKMVARRRFEELPNEVTLYSQQRSAAASTASSSLTTTGSGSSRRRPLRLQNGGSRSGSAGGPVRAKEEENGCSFKFYGRGGHSNSTSSVSTTFNSSRGLSRSKNDSLILSSSSSSVAAMRVSTASDRLSVDNNFGSYNPRALYIDNGYASSIKEHDDDDDALQQLHGWLQASPSSTAGSFAAPRNIHCF
ncbi:hypothetical protein Gpo141_00006092 [Globisporangium polare]